MHASIELAFLTPLPSAPTPIAPRTALAAHEVRQPVLAAVGAQAVDCP